MNRETERYYVRIGSPRRIRNGNAVVVRDCNMRVLQ